MMKTLSLALAAFMLPLASAGFAAEGDLSLSDGYARSSNPKAGAVFAMLHNAGGSDCTLQAVATDSAEVAELHTHEHGADGVMRMTKVEAGFTVPAGGTHLLERGGDHIMLMGLTAPLENGAEVALTLEFGDCGTLQATVPVDNDRQAEAAAPMAHDGEPMMQH